MKCGGFVHQPWGVSTIVKVPGSVLHGVDSPLRNFHGKRYALGISIAEEHQSINRLGSALDVNGQGLVIVVPGSPIGQKERLLPKVVTTRHNRFELTVTCGGNVELEAVQDVGSMKIVNPMQI